MYIDKKEQEQNIQLLGEDKKLLELSHVQILKKYIDDKDSQIISMTNSSSPTSLPIFKDIKKHLLYLLKNNIPFNLSELCQRNYWYFFQVYGLIPIFSDKDIVEALESKENRIVELHGDDFPLNIPSDFNNFAYFSCKDRIELLSNYYTIMFLNNACVIYSINDNFDINNSFIQFECVGVNLIYKIDYTNYKDKFQFVSNFFYATNILDLKILPTFSHDAVWKFYYLNFTKNINDFYEEAKNHQERWQRNIDTLYEKQKQNR